MKNLLAAQWRDSAEIPLVRSTYIATYSRCHDIDEQSNYRSIRVGSLVESEIESTSKARTRGVSRRSVRSLLSKESRRSVKLSAQRVKRDRATTITTVARRRNTREDAARRRSNASKGDTCSAPLARSRLPSPPPPPPSGVARRAIKQLTKRHDLDPSPSRSIGRA